MSVLDGVTGGSHGWPSIHDPPHRHRCVPRHGGDELPGWNEVRYLPPGLTTCRSATRSTTGLPHILDGRTHHDVERHRHHHTGVGQSKSTSWTVGRVDACHLAATAATTSTWVVYGPLGYFADEFVGSSLDLATWSVYNRLGDQDNSEVNAVIPANARVAGGSLFIDSKFEDVMAGDTTTGPPNSTPRPLHVCTDLFEEHVPLRPGGRAGQDRRRYRPVAVYLDARLHAATAPAELGG